MSLITQSPYYAQMVKASENQDAAALADMHDTITTLEEHARKVKDNTGKIREFTALRIWNLYHLGRVLNELCPHGGARPQGVVLTTLENFGISWRLSTNSRQIAAMDTEDIRTFIDESGDEINVSHLLRLHTESTTPAPEWDEEANWRMLQAMVRDFYERAEDEEHLNKCADFLEDNNGKSDE